MVSLNAIKFFGKSKNTPAPQWLLKVAKLCLKTFLQPFQTGTARQTGINSELPTRINFSVCTVLS